VSPSATSSAIAEAPASAAAASPDAPSPRYDGLDVLRATAMFLGLAYHACWAYVPDIGPWYVVQDVSTAEAFKSLASVLHAFRMQAFFALSGFFAHLVLERRGLHGFVSDRARRLLIPLAVGAPLVVLVDWLSQRASQAVGAYSSDYHWGIGLSVRPLHLWFLVLLSFFVAVTAGAAALGLTGHSMGRALGRVLAWPELLLLGAVPTAWALTHFGEPTPANGYLPQAAAVAHYGPFFALGFWLWSARERVGPLVRRRWLFTALGLGLAGWLFTRDLQYRPEGLWWSALATWLLVLGLLGFAFGLETAPRPRLAAAVDASYWVYLVHYPLVLGGHVALAKLPWPALLKFLLVVGFATAGAVGSWALVRDTRVGRFLGSRRAAPSAVTTAQG
jgi:peptidoglycan/LPS O-acetylase OafA/YrhL